MHQRCVSCCASVLLIAALPAAAFGQSTTYHLHREASKTAGLLQLKTIGPDAGAATIATDLKNKPVNEYLIKAFDTPAGAPNATGTIPAGSVVSFTLWMRKTTTAGVMYPRAKMRLNSATGSPLCVSTGATPLTTTVASYTLSCATTANVAMSVADRLYLWVGVSVTTAPDNNAVKAELRIEGTANGKYDSQVVAPLPILPPAINSLSPTSGAVGTPVSIAGSNFGDSQGTNAVTFNGVAAAATAWSAGGITASVPAGASTGPVVVTVRGLASNGVLFTVPPIATGLSPANGPIGTAVTITGANFGVTQGNSNLAFNGVIAMPTTWNASSITAPVPSGATTGSVVITVDGFASNGIAFAVAPNITSVSPPSGLEGTDVMIGGSTFGPAQGTSTVTFNGIAATVASWSPSSIVASVPVGAATGNVVVTADGLASNGVPFVVPPVINSLSPASGRIGTAVSVSGSGFGGAQGSSAVTFNGVNALPTSWSNTKIATSVPEGASSGIVVVTVADHASGGMPFTVVVPGSIAGAITSASGGNPIANATVVATSMGTTAGVTTTAADGSYSIANLDPGSYELRMAAAGYSDEIRQNVIVTAATTTSVNVAMSAPGAVSGRVTETDGVTPIGGAAVSVYAGSNRIGAANTDSAGDYTVVSLHPGSFIVQAASVGHRTSEQPATVAENSTTFVTFALEGDSGGTVLYAYDALGRLVQVTDPSGQSAVYRYDAVGNLLAIERPGSGGSSAVAISDIAPTRGPIGTVVTIAGTGFSPTAGENTVTFNGTATSVTSASPNHLVAPVPAGATTGPVSVTMPLGSATSNGPFTVTANTGAPTITSFAPTVGVAGTVVTISGINFDPALANNLVTFNTKRTDVTSANPTTLVAPVPSAAMGGPITVATPLGTGVSSADFFIPPSPYTAADVVVADRIAPGGSKNVSIGTSGRLGLLLFDGTAGQVVSVTSTSSTWTSCQFGGQYSLTIIRPDASTQVTVSNGCGATTLIDQQILPVTGTYTLMLDPYGANTGSATITLYTVVDVTGPIATDGTGVPVSITTPGQNARLTFTATAGQIVSATSTSSTWTSCQFGGQYSLTMLKPDGSTLVSVGNACGSTTFIDHVTAPVSGTYTVKLDPYGANTGSATLAVYAFNDVTGPIPADGTAMPVSITAPGQIALMTFTGTAGQLVSTTSTSSTWTSCQFGGQYSLTILKPDGSTLAGSGNACGSTTVLEHYTLPVSGTYSVMLDPYGAYTGSATLRVWTFTDVATPITADATSVQVSITVPGQNARLTFTGAAGQAVSVLVPSGTIPGNCFDYAYWLSILKPDGSSLVDAYSCFATTFLDQRTLPVSGTYTLVINPQGVHTGDATVRLFTVVDETGPITADGIGRPVSITTPGQNARLTFTGAAGQVVTASATNSSIPGTCFNYAYYLTIFKPDGSILAGQPSCGGSLWLSQKTLPVDGTYTLFLDPMGANIGSATLTLSSP